MASQYSRRPLAQVKGPDLAINGGLPESSNGRDRIEVTVKLHQAVKDLVHHRMRINIGSVGWIEGRRVPSEGAPVDAAKACGEVSRRISSHHRCCKGEEGTESQERSEVPDK